MQCTAPVRSTVRVFASLMVMFAIAAGLASAAEQRVHEVNYSSVEVHGIKVFYRDAGPADGPPILLLHGFPASSHMFRDLMVKLADRYRVIAPDYPGYGRSDAPSAAQFNYTFERLTDVVESLSEKLGLARYSLYMQDFGGPVGFRLATRHPERVQALIVQNAVVHAEDCLTALPRQGRTGRIAALKPKSRCAIFSRSRRLASSACMGQAARNASTPIPGYCLRHCLTVPAMQISSSHCSTTVAPNAAPQGDSNGGVVIDTDVQHRVTK